MKNILLILSIWLSACLAGSAQSLPEKLGGIPTAFAFTSNEKELKIQSQLLFERTIGTSDYGSVNDGAYGYGYGEDRLKLEFATTDEIDDRYSSSRYSHIKFYDKEGNLLLYWTRGNLHFFAKANQVSYYSIDLTGFPLTFLNEIHQLDIVLYCRQCGETDKNVENP